MDASAPVKVKVLACSIFRDEIEALLKKPGLFLDLSYLDSILHLKPEILRRLMDERLTEMHADGSAVFILFGECHAFMDKDESRGWTGRSPGINCVEILLGSETYHRLRAEGDFFIIREWALRWKEVFRDGLGLNEANARSLMRESHSRLLYLDTGIKPPPLEMLEEFSAYVGLPYAIMGLTLEFLQKSLEEGIERLRGYGRA